MFRFILPLAAGLLGESTVPEAINHDEQLSNILQSLFEEEDQQSVPFEPEDTIGAFPDLDDPATESHQLSQVKDYTVCTYNVQSFHHRDLNTVLRTLNTDVVILQSTGTRWDNWTRRQENQDFFCKNIGLYWVIFWPYDFSNIYANRSWGIVVAIKRTTFPKSCLSRVWTPPKKLQGRVGAIRIRTRKGPDLLICDVYQLPIGSLNYVELTADIWHWIETVLQEQVHRTLPIVGLDANARLGNWETRSVEGETLSWQ